MTENEQQSEEKTMESKEFLEMNLNESECVQVRRFIPSENLLGSACCIIGWCRSGKTTTCKSIAKDLGIINGCREVHAVKGDFIANEIPCNGKGVLIDTCSAFCETSPCARQYFQYIFVTGKVSDREWDRIYNFYAHLLPYGKQYLMTIVKFIAENCGPYDSVVIDVSHEVRKNKNKAAIYYYCSHQ